MFLVVYDYVFEQQALWDEWHDPSVLDQKLKDIYQQHVDRDTIVMPLMQMYDCILTQVSHVFNPFDGLKFEKVLAILIDLHEKYQEQEKTNDGSREVCYINFTNVIKRCIGNLHLQNLFFINTACEDLADAEMEQTITFVTAALEEVHGHYSDSHPLFQVKKEDMSSYNDYFSGPAMLIYLIYCRKQYAEASKYALYTLVDNQDRIASNFLRSQVALQIPLSTFICDDRLLRFLAEASTAQTNPVDRTFNPRECPVIFVSPLPLIIHVYILSMIALDFENKEAISSTFTMSTCLSLLEGCYDTDKVPFNKFLYDQTKVAYDSYADQRRIREGGHWDPYLTLDDNSTDSEDEKNENK
ncbi:unnamed protein product [Didymodactylos carnosus]|uniref:Uncharacterized protein n=1 Tax=Didymodactylos carnosus TaxID=1234261 RepID=A0A814QKK9_9BILA|nr:unnamed protein product [Didymodactylos carnosus]CAF3885088.1 unnamed protein product [Didymodactylos carnosus]